MKRFNCYKKNICIVNYSLRAVYIYKKFLCFVGFYLLEKRTNLYFSFDCKNLNVPEGEYE